MAKPASPDPQAICFGLNRELNRCSCAAYLQLLGNLELMETPASRLSSEEIEELVQLSSSLLRKHLSKREISLPVPGQESGSSGLMSYQRRVIV